jgi:hypothetical protein
VPHTRRRIDLHFNIIVCASACGPSAPPVAIARDAPFGAECRRRTNAFGNARPVLATRRTSRPNGVARVSLLEVRMVEADDGVELWVEVTGSDDRVPVVLCHGGPGLWDNLGVLAALLEISTNLVYRWSAGR